MRVRGKRVRDVVKFGAIHGFESLGGAAIVTKLQFIRSRQQWALQYVHPSVGSNTVYVDREDLLHA